MALTDADRLQIVAMALMRHSVLGGGGTTIITKNFFNGTAIESVPEYGSVTASVTYTAYVGV